MPLTRGKLGKVVILRPGALGDVLAVRGVVAFLRRVFPAVEIVLAAPGERGAFFRRPGWADRTLDWDRAAFSWLFADASSDPPPALSAAFSASDLLLSYVHFADSAARDDYEARLARLAPAASRVLCPPVPPEHHRQPVGRWLVAAALGFCLRSGLLTAADRMRAGMFDDARIVLPGPSAFAPRAGGRYAVLHPGSGSRRKNWPAENFARLGWLFASHADAGGKPFFDRLFVVSGEADGTLGEQVAETIPGAVNVHGQSLETVAGLLAGAHTFVGNDSGVSHLAAAVEMADGSRCRQAVLFGPSDPEIWAPPGALVLRAGDDMGGLPVGDAWREIRDALPRRD